jgi:hypothetical protein
MHHPEGDLIQGDPGYRHCSAGAYIPEREFGARSAERNAGKSAWAVELAPPHCLFAALRRSITDWYWNSAPIGIYKDP